MDKKIEILAPAGDKSAFVGAISSGADAIYLGTQAFNARLRAENFTTENMPEVLRLAHAHGVKVYVTINTAVYDRELGALLDEVVALWNMGTDAFIVADLGVMSLIKKHLPEIELHASTQCTVHNLDGADFLADTQGVSRVVLARELDNDNIKYISQNARAETEIFVHGAHCMSVSGQCLLSFAMGGRSGNRGECAQPCRLPYQIGNTKGYPLSLKDMSLCRQIPKILESGAASLKIEGRMKGQDYVGGTVAVWRRLVDEKRNATNGELSTLGALFSRQGFTDGYFNGKIDKTMLGVRTDENKQESSLLEKREYTIKPVPVSLNAELRIGSPARLELTANNKSVVVYGDVVENAINAPMSKDDIIKSLSKLGGTPFTLESIEVVKDDGIMVRVSALNKLRRDAIDKYFDKADKVIVPALEKEEIKHPKRIKTALFSSSSQIPENKDYFDITFLYLDRYKTGDSVNGIAMPPVIFDSQWQEIEGKLSAAKADGIEYALVTNIGQITRLKKHGFKLIFDYRFNVFNRPCVDYLQCCGAENIVMSPELTLPQLRDFGGFMVVAYGKIPVMTTHKCVIRDTEGCQSGKAYLKDRQGAKMFCECAFGHTNIIYNSVPIYMADKQGDISHLSWHFIFSDESKNECYDIIEAYRKKAPTNKALRRIK
ncbi:MAG: U32 family peptidase [Clostridia bacterium]|nr:U32 family peptidase [Clostridia bacterium]